MSKWKDYKLYDGLVWKIHNHNLFGFKPDDDDIAQKVYYLRRNGENSQVEFSQLEEDGNVSNKIILENSEKACKVFWDALGDERVDPKMVCSATFQISR